jgi:hypothetical protein
VLEQRLNQTAGENVATAVKLQETAQLLEEQDAMQNEFRKVKNP